MTGGGTLVIVGLLGGVALLLWGVRMVKTGIMRGWGDRLNGFIEQRLAPRPLPAVSLPPPYWEARRPWR